MHTRRWLWIWTVWLLAGSAQAQVTASDKATAEALFDRGVALLKEGKLEEACARLEQSNSVEHGLGTMLWLAECYEKSGRTASAWALFREAASEAQAAGQTDRATAGRQRAERLEPTLSRLTVEVPEAHRVPGLEVTRNGAPVPKGLWGLPLPVDPGEQRLEAHAAGYLPHASTVLVDKGPGSSKVTIPALAAAPVPSVAESTPMQTAPVAALPAASPVPAGPVAPVAEPPHGLSTQKLLGIIAGSTGIVFLAVGAGFGARAKSKNDDAKKICSGKTCDDQHGVDLTDSALTASRVADVGIIGGAALLAGGLITYFVAPKGEHQTKVAFSADQRGGALQVGGVF